jgi:hypothetical protein
MERFESIFRCEARRIFNRAPVNSMDEIAEKDRVSLTIHHGSMGILRASLSELFASLAELT